MLREAFFGAAQRTQFRALDIQLHHVARAFAP
jgi:hypothetical protein